MIKINEDTYKVSEGLDEDIVIGGLVLAWEENRALFESLSEWYWTDDNPDVDEDERCLDLIKDIYDLIAQYGEDVIWPS